MVASLIRICRIQCCYSLFLFSTKNTHPSLANFFLRIKIVSLRWNLILRLIGVCRVQWRCSLFLFRLEILFGGKFGPKNEDCKFKLKFDTQKNSNILNSVVMFTFSVLYWKYPFRANLVQKVKIFSLSWNLVASLIWICKIQWCCWLFPFSTGNTLFGQIWSKKSKLSV